MSQVEIVGCGADTVVLNIYPTDTNFQVVPRRVAAELQEELSVLKQRAQDEEEDIASRFVFSGANLLMRTKGSEGFNWILHSASLTLAINRGSKMAMLGQVRLSSEYLWSKEFLSEALYEVHVFLMSIFGEYILLQPSSFDLAVDVVNLDLGTVQEIKDHFITRAQLDDQMPLDTSEDGMLDGPDCIKRRWRRVTGLPFGARTGQVSALLYDKTHEIKYKSPGKKWFHDKWLAARQEDGTPVWDGESTVWRIEVRFKRRALHEFKQEGVFHGIEDAYDLEERIPGLWAYAVGHAGGGEDGLPDGWLRYVVPTGDTNRSRWPVHPAWEVIQGAFIPELVPESEYEREEREREELLCLVDEELAARPMGTSHTKAYRHRSASSEKPARLAAGGETSGAPVAPARFDLKPFIRQRHYEVNMYRMVAQIAGCVETAEAWRLLSPDERLSDGVNPDLSDTFHFLFRNVEAYLQEKERDYSQRVHKKRVVYSLEAITA